MKQGLIATSALHARLTNCLIGICLVFLPNSFLIKASSVYSLFLPPEFPSGIFRQAIFAAIR